MGKYCYNCGRETFGFENEFNVCEKCIKIVEDAEKENTRSRKIPKFPTLYKANEYTAKLREDFSKELKELLKQKRIKMLEEKMKIAKENYYGLGKTDLDDQYILTDSEFEELEGELKELNPNSKLLNVVGVEEDLSRFKHLHHSIPMLSMAKVNSVVDFNDWYDYVIKNLLRYVRRDDIEFGIEPKIDGFSCTIFYKNGKFEKLGSRGDGKKGFIMPHEYINDIPKEIPYKENVEVRGELYIPIHYKDKKELPYDTPLRNFAVGAIRGSDVEKQKFVHFIAYDIVPHNKFRDDEEIINKLKECRFKVVEFAKLKTKEEILNFYNTYVDSLRGSWDYETDGLVITLLRTVQKELIDPIKSTDHHHNYNIAYKPPSKGKWTKLLDVKWCTNRTGIITPVGILEPARVDNVLISKVTLYNKSFIEVNDIKIGDEVKIVRANDVIPALTESRHTKDKKDIILKVCPSCKSPIVDKGKNYFCPNQLGCNAQRINKFTYWFKSNEIDNLSDQLTERIVNAGIMEIWELYAMSKIELISFLERVLNLSRETNKFKQIINSFDNSRDQTEQSVIGRYGIPTIGTRILKRLKIQTMNDLLAYKDIRHLDNESKVIVNLCKWLNDNKNCDNLFYLIKYLKPKGKVEISDKKKKTFCITGGFGTPRNKLIKEIEDTLNIEFTPTVSKFTSLLISSNNGVTEKEKAATKYSVPIYHTKNVVNYDELRDILNIK